MTQTLDELTIDHFRDAKREPPLLLRRIAEPGSLIDEVYLDGAWRPTKIIWDYMFGHDDFVDGIGENEARALEPAAF